MTNKTVTFSYTPSHHHISIPHARARLVCIRPSLLSYRSPQLFVNLTHRPTHPPSLPTLKLGADGAIVVNELMQASAPCVYAAGDACHVQLPPAFAEDIEWFQMRLWSQARAQGVWAAYCMLERQ